jgi:hypothetical protein
MVVRSNSRRRGMKMLESGTPAVAENAADLAADEALRRP